MMRLLCPLAPASLFLSAIITPHKHLIGRVIAFLPLILVTLNFKINVDLLESYPQQHAITQTNQHRIDNQIT